MRRRTTFPIAAFLLLLAFFAQATPVKKSSSGLCHSHESAYYDRTQNFTPYSSVTACLQSGGRLLGGHTVRAGELVDQEYERSRFGHGWADVDNDCRNSRMEALIEQSTSSVRFASNRKCRVVSGRWISPYTGDVIYEASKMDVDHVVPLQWAWERGADLWHQEKRERFANDPVNLWSVEVSLNRQKGAKGPDTWMPPSGKCQYVSRFSRVLKMYGLRPSVQERQAIDKLRAHHCYSG